MFGITHFEFFVVAVFLLNVTPGPDTAYIVGRSVAQGRGAGLMSVLGISAGSCVHSLACAFGLTALLAASATAFTIIKFVGAIYLIYLGVRLIFAKPATDQAGGEARGAGAPKSLRQLFLQGFWTNVLNPKVVLFFVSFFPQFVTTGGDHKTLAFLTLGGVFVVMSMMWNSFVAWIAGSVTQRFSGKPSVKKWLDRGVGGAFVGLGIKLATASR
ncbi:LysE family translocator [Paraburkholderia sp. 22099]|jgi:RhtB (resistance to homoserine/threonine) family protein|uniref:Resistance to homoserine/threonine (RhtB) family protein n=1 Tax=Paraburkholderia terricola TaxID=169427 RepID=A0A1M6SFL7_9BURK|nr:MULTISPECIES: LysE family translocator [Paraburkholderia]AXE90968.1 LysE family translocator [Paraburkholderia terricola]MDR6410726.1 RhtB (resistance to homoserine/threonine) family protein [Paraburkholderia terricola]MDR6484962.1 RhtB (resistance to homoserine/threonine) family protein [Paraburkholderia terricola]MDR6495560.1 RhtB (resistance to homoserine/threonine) family protein [Paraburkholderia terricola]SDO61388.1 resistance to homoserine/threonine (RhtB) family protein [Paraburkhol